MTAKWRARLMAMRAWLNLPAPRWVAVAALIAGLLTNCFGG